MVEDEILVRLMAAEDLRDQGFRVIEAADADEALAVIETAGHIDLVVTDVKMPGTLDGLGLARALRLSHPALRIVVVSGEKLDPESAAVADVVFAKPYDAPRLVRAIRDLIGGETA